MSPPTRWRSSAKKSAITGSDTRIAPAAAYYDRGLKEFLLPYEAVRTATRPADEILAFGESCYEAATRLGKWDRTALERFGPA